MKLKLSKKEINYALYGLVLGNGFYKNGVIHIKWSEKKKFYVQWLEQFCKSQKIKHVIQKDDAGKINFLKIWVPDRRHFENNRVVDSNNKKIISTYVLKRITPLGILLWYLDKGHLYVSVKENKVKRFAYLNTQTYSKFENNLIRKMFKERFGIDTKLHEINRKKSENVEFFRIYINATNFKIFYSVVKSFLSIIPSELRIKFNMKYESNHSNSNAELLKKDNIE